METSATKSRFAPSPTGLIHIGNARTALFNALLAKQAQGTFLLRIEDTDQERSKEAFTQALMRDLCWINARWDEGPDIGGELGPYWQSERQAIYDRYYKKLEDSGMAYPCFCSQQQLALTRKVQRAAGQAPRYPGTCRELNESEIQDKLQQGLKPTLRLHIADDTVIEFIDLVKGPQIFRGNDIGDFIIRRANGTPSFMFSNAIDDSMMNVTHTLRGEDHLTNTPRQLMILKTLGMRTPQYGHISLIVGNDSSPLSKRHGSKSLQELKQEGWLAEALINYLARLGHYYADNTFMSFNQLAENFSIKHLSNSPAKFDPQQMLYWQKQAVLQLSNTQFLQWLNDANTKINIEQDKQALFIDAIKPNIVFPNEGQHWANIFFTDFSFSDEAKTIIQQAGKDFFVTTINAVTQYGADIKTITNIVKEQCNIKGKRLFMPLRFALTGEQHGPEMAAIAKLLGAEKMIERLQNAKEMCNA